LACKRFFALKQAPAHCLSVGVCPQAIFSFAGSPLQLYFCRNSSPAGITAGVFLKEQHHGSCTTD
ncbi:hypothetical protein, partial [Alcanivorax sp. P2S70]|uniref:hypothetical protein n=1 Tax=Alcanivorax sp. P2S70 TaxID=1397527 RepID=UPI001F1D62F8